MTLEEFVADLRATSHADHDAMLQWTGEQQARALIEGLDWQKICALIAQQAVSVKKSVETP